MNVSYSTCIYFNQICIDCNCTVTILSTMPLKACKFYIFIYSQFTNRKHYISNCLHCQFLVLKAHDKHYGGIYT